MSRPSNSRALSLGITRLGKAIVDGHLSLLAARVSPEYSPMLTIALESRSYETDIERTLLQIRLPDVVLMA